MFWVLFVYSAKHNSRWGQGTRYGTSCVSKAKILNNKKRDTRLFTEGKHRLKAECARHYLVLASDK